MSTAGQSGAATRPDASKPAGSPNRPAERSAGRPTEGMSTSALPGGSRPAGTTATATGGAPRPAAARRVKLTVSRVDPWSVMKMSFLLSVAVGIAGVVLMAVLWLILSGMGVFADVNRTVESVLGTSGGTKFDLMDYIGFGRVVSLSIVIGVIDVVLMTAIATLGAFLYNVCSALVGGLQLTLTDD
ncbi:MAG TPA: DUF3566 domain-containing protein [Oryzihumus sp.]|nr:DUF3566 domain-containing protein [Oryzihumus sp.]